MSPSQPRASHGEGKRAVCDLCGKPFKDTRAVKVHMKVHAISLMDIDSAHECVQCGKRFTLKAALSNHVKIHANPNSRTAKRLRFEKRTLDQSEMTHIRVGSSLEDGGDGHCDGEEQSVSHTSVLCFLCMGQVRRETLWSHMQMHVKSLMQVCEETARTMTEFHPVLGGEQL